MWVWVCVGGRGRGLHGSYSKGCAAYVDLVVCGVGGWALVGVGRYVSECLGGFECGCVCVWVWIPWIL